MLFWAQCHYSEIAQRIFKYSDIRYTSLTPDKILNSLVYRTLFCVNIYAWVTNFRRTVRFFGPPCSKYRYTQTQSPQTRQLPRSTAHGTWRPPNNRVCRRSYFKDAGMIGAWRAFSSSKSLCIRLVAVSWVYSELYRRRELMMPVAATNDRHRVHCHRKTDKYSQLL